MEVINPSESMPGNDRDIDNRIPDSPLCYPVPYSGKGFRGMGKHNGTLNGTQTRTLRGAAYSKPHILPRNYLERMDDKWFIFYRERIDGKLKGVKKRFDINQHEGEEKIRIAQKYLTELVNLLSGGWVQKIEDNEFSLIASSELSKALDEVFKLESPGWSKKTVSSYESSKRIFIKFLTEKRIKVKPRDFQKAHAKMYSDWLLPQYDLTTHNNHLGYAKTFFGYFISRDILEVNPFSMVKKKRDGAGGHLPFTEVQFTKLRHYGETHKPFWTFCLFAADSLMRTNELATLRISDLEGNKIKITHNTRAGKSVKDKETRIIEIDQRIMNRLKMQIKGFPDHYLVFGRNFMPADKVSWRDGVSKEFTKILRGLGFGEEYVLYSLRHYGASRKLKSGMLPHRLMRMLGHENLTTTQIYLRGLGLDFD